MLTAYQVPGCVTRMYYLVESFCKYKYHPHFSEWQKFGDMDNQEWRQNLNSDDQT